MNTRQERTGAPVSDETPTPAHPDRPTSTKPVDERRRLRNLAESHAHEADRLAHERAGLTHALLAHFWLNHARTERP